MNRIDAVEYSNATPEQKALFDTIQLRLGRVPNVLKVFAQSTVALQAVWGLSGVARAGSLSPQTRERIALALAQRGSCEYELSEHTILGRQIGLTGNEMAANRAGSSEDAKAAVAVRLALELAEHRDGITTDELDRARAAGHTDADIVEIVTHVGMSLLTQMMARAGCVASDGPTGTSGGV